MTHLKREMGFSTIEMAIVVTIFALLAVLAIPQFLSTMRAFRVASDARSIATQLALAKMRAADGFTQSRFNCDLTNNSCQLEICTSKGATACNTFTAEGGALNLSTGVSFGFGSITTPAGSQSTIQNTAQIIFNSRSLPLDSNGVPTANDALYVTDQYGNSHAVTVDVTGRVAVWRYSNSAWHVQ